MRQLVGIVLCLTILLLFIGTPIEANEWQLNPVQLNSSTTDETPIVTFDAKTIVSITITNSYSIESFRKQNNQWFGLGQQNSESVHELLVILEQMKAGALAPSLTMTEFGFFPQVGAWQIVLVLNSGDKVVIDIGAEYQILGGDLFCLGGHFVRICQGPVVLVSEFYSQHVRELLHDLLRRE